MTKKYYNLLDDYVFKSIFNLNTVLGKTCILHTLYVFAGIDLDTTITLVNKEHIIDLGNGRKVNMDCLFHVGDNLMIDMEAQKQNVSYDPERLINYLSIMDVSQLKVGETHKNGRSIILYFMGFPYEIEKNAMMRFQDGVKITEKFLIKFIPVYGLESILIKEPDRMTQKERYQVYLGYSHKEEYQGLMRQLEEMEEGLMAIHDQVLTQRSVLDLFVQMKEEDRKKQVRDELVAEYKSKMELERKIRIEEHEKRIEERQKRIEERQKRIEEQKKRARSDYIIELIGQGYTLDEAQKMAMEKFCL